MLYVQLYPGEHKFVQDLNVTIHELTFQHGNINDLSLSQQVLITLKFPFASFLDLATTF